MIRDFQPGDRVRVAEDWATKPDRPAGTVKAIVTGGYRGQWVSVRFDGYVEEQVCMARELERE
jgi:hypothetical protein